MITFTGDLFIGDKSIKIEESIINKMNSSDYIFSNFESVIDLDGLKKREDKNAILLTKPQCLKQYLSIFNTKIIFGLGNNHVHDLGEKGILHLKKGFSRQNNIQITGVGLLNEVINPLIIEVKKIKIAFLTASTDEPEVMSIISTSKKHGVLNYTEDFIIEIIKQTKRKVDYFVVLPHWGEEHIRYPTYQIRKRAYKWIEAGADLVIGNHPHTIQGKEVYKNKHIYYSLGNFIFTTYYDKNNRFQGFNKESNYSIMLQILFNNEILIEETGLYFDSNKNKLFESSKSLLMLKNASFALNVQNISYKKYYGIWQKEKYKKLKKIYSRVNFIKRIIKQKHRKYSFLNLIFLKIRSALHK